MLRGTLDDFTLPDIFRLMSLSKKSGSLQVERSAGRGTVYFRDGEVYFAESSLSREPLGQKLVRMKVITEGQLRKALDAHASEGKRLGQVLMDSGMVTDSDIMSAVRAQIEDAVFDLLRWELGEFVWEPNQSIDPEVEIYVSVENLIMEASRRLEELEVIQRKIPSMDTVLAMSPKPPEGALEINITPDEWRLLVLVNGHHSVADIAGMTGSDDLTAMKALYGLLSAGLIEVPGHVDQFEDGGPPGDDFPPAEARVEEEVSAPGPEPEPSATPDPEGGSDTEPAPEPLQETEQEPVAAEASTEETLAHMEADLASDEPQAGAEPEPEPETVPVDQFDAPAPGELTTQGPAGDPFADEILAPEPAAPEPASEEETTAPAPEPEPEPEPVAQAEPEPVAQAEPEQPAAEAEPQPAPAAPAAPEIPVSSAPQGESPAVDRIAAVRELAGLFGDEDEERPKPVSSGPPPRPKRVEDDEQVTRGLISRLIDGVKGL